MFWILVALAQAAPLACAEIETLHKVGVPDDVILGTIADAGVLDEDLPCIEALGLAGNVTEAARQHAVARSKPLEDVIAPVIPESTTVAQVPAPCPEFRPVRRGDRFPLTGTCSDEWLELHRRSPGVAAVLGGFIGYGTGHFFARRPAPGAIFLAIDLVATGLVLGGSLAWKDYGYGVKGPSFAPIIAGSILFPVSRLAQVISAPIVATEAGERDLEACGR